MKRLFFTVFALAFPFLGFANLAPFGLEIGKVTLSELKNKYHDLKNVGTGEYSGGDIYELPVSNLDFEGASEALLIFDDQNKLVAINLTLDQKKFNYLLEILAKKYQLISKATPFLGNKTVEFADGQGRILLGAPHMSFNMSMIYTTQNFLSKVDERRDEDEQQQETHDAALL